MKARLTACLKRTEIGVGGTPTVRTDTLPGVFLGNVATALAGGRSPRLTVLLVAAFAVDAHHALFSRNNFGGIVSTVACGLVFARRRLAVGVINDRARINSVGLEPALQLILA